MRRWADSSPTSDRSVGVFGVLGTSFAVLLAFVIFLAFESYGTAKQNAGTEAVPVNGLFGTARLLPRSARERLRGVLICYSRAVVADEWRTMKDGHESPLVDDWAADLDTITARLDITARSRHPASRTGWSSRPHAETTVAVVSRRPHRSCLHRSG
jgi:hypothetical protein